MADLDFQGLASELLSSVRDILPKWLPGGKLMGREYVCGSLRGEPGRSLSVNIQTGAWADFSGDEKGGDLISLYAAIEGIGQGEAFRRLAEDTGFSLRDSTPYDPSNAPARVAAPPEVCKPPEDAEGPAMDHPVFGLPTASWCYLDTDGGPLFYIARYDTEDGKQIVPWSWSVKEDEGWIMKGWPSPRPLYGLRKLAEMPQGKSILICEGEKAADAAQQIVGDLYVCMTWPNGAKAVQRADWSPIYGRQILIWPDADLLIADTEEKAKKANVALGEIMPYDFQAGIKCAREIAHLLSPHCPQVKIIEVGMDYNRAAGWDAADALEEGWDWETLKNWATPLVTVYKIELENNKIEKPAIETVEVVAEAEAPGARAAAAVQVNIEQDSDEVSSSAYALHQKYGIVCTKQGNPVCNADNVIRVFDGIPDMQGLVWYDEFHQKYFTDWDCEKPREWSDLDDMKIMYFLQRKVGLLRMSDDIVHKAVMVYADRTTKNEPRDWMNTLAWDGKERLENFFIECFGVNESNYARAASKNWWVGMVARIFQPGCKLDNMIILQGNQGKYKSTALSVIGGAWYAEAHESPTSKDFYMGLHGKMIIEIADLDAFKRAEDTLIKKLLTCRSDRYRPPYGRASQDFLRQCIFVGTTNEEAFLKDHTGARRFWPFKTSHIDIDKIREDRDQLFAEAVHVFKNAGKWWEMPGGETEDEQESYRQTDEWESIVSDFVRMKEETTVREVALEGLRIEVSKLDPPVQRRIGKTLRVLGWTHHNTKTGDVNRKIWRKPGFYYEPPEY